MSAVPPEAKVTSVIRYKTVVSSGQAALRALLTMNGGATLAFLTFLGHLWDQKALPSESGILVSALQLFIYGTFLAVLAYGTIFLTNCLSAYHWEKTAYVMFAFTVVFGFLSLMCFLKASGHAVDGFKTVAVLPRK